MKTFFDLAKEDWRIQLEEGYDINEPSICYLDPDRRGYFVGPLAVVYVGSTVEDGDGNELLDLSAADGRNLAAVACLPQLAELCAWIKESCAKLGVSDSQEYNDFVDALADRVDWIEACIDDRPEEMGPGMHGFERYKE